MSLVAVSVIIGIVGVIGGLLFQARQSIVEGRRQQEAREKAIRDEGYAAGVASVQPELLNLRSDLAEMKDNRDYYRGIRGGGTDHRSQGDTSGH